MNIQPEICAFASFKLLPLCCAAWAGHAGVYAHVNTVHMQLHGCDVLCICVMPKCRHLTTVTTVYQFKSASLAYKQDD